MRVNIIILGCLYLLPAIFGSEEKNDTAFVPTSKWQTVKKGTPIPEGLHVRVNFGTGVIEAKLMDNEDAEEEKNDKRLNDLHSKSLSVHVDETPLGAKEEKELLEHLIDELKARFKKMNKDDVKSATDTNDEEREAMIKKKFRDYETLKKELKALKVNITTDSELLTSYFQEFEPHKNAIITGTLTVLETEEVLDILHNLENLLHQIDNAKVFADMQGMSKVISPCLNGTSNEIKAEALRVLGAAVQSNPRVQVKALQSDLVQKILHILSTNSKVEVKSRCLFALSALIRQFPAAQKVWIDHGGLEIFGKILIDGQLQIQLKVIKLVNDLITERENLKGTTDTQYREQKLKAYAVANIQEKLLVHEYCKHLSDLIIKRCQGDINDQFKSEDYEFLETASESITTIAPICELVFKSNKDSLLPVISHLLKFYQNSDESNEQDGNDEIMKNLALLMERLQQAADAEMSRDEL